MKWPISIYLTAAIAAASSSPVSSARVKLEPAKPGYYCSVGKANDDVTWGDATLDAAGIVQESDWTWGTRSFGDPFQLLILGGRVSKDNRVADNGTAFLKWNLTSDARRSPPKRLVQLTSSSQQGFIWSGFGTGQFEKSWTPTLMIYWPDLLAFAKSAPALNFYLLDDKHGFIEGQSLDREVFLKADVQINAMLTALNAKVAKFQSECDKVDDIINRDIII